MSGQNFITGLAPPNDHIHITITGTYYGWRVCASYHQSRRLQPLIRFTRIIFPSRLCRPVSFEARYVLFARFGGTLTVMVHPPPEDMTINGSYPGLPVPAGPLDMPHCPINRLPPTLNPIGPPGHPHPSTTWSPSPLSDPRSGTARDPGTGRIPETPLTPGQSGRRGGPSLRRAARR